MVSWFAPPLGKRSAAFPYHWHPPPFHLSNSIVGALEVTRATLLIGLVKSLILGKDGRLFPRLRGMSVKLLANSGR
jgi:hypothetical protein